MTKEVCADAFGMPLVEDAHTREHLKEFFRNNIYRHIPDNNWKMATVPQGALVLDNANGMAPGLILERRARPLSCFRDLPMNCIPCSAGRCFLISSKSRTRCWYPVWLKSADTEKAR